MTEKMTPERSAFLLADASRILRRKLLAWPETLQPGELAALLAGADKGEQFRERDYQIMRAIEAGHLTVRTETRETVKQGRIIDTGNRTAFAGMAARVVFHEPAKKVIHTLRHIAPEAAAAWFHAVRMSPCDTVRAWLGPAWQEKAQQVRAGKTVPAADSRPGERRGYFRSLWLELDKPARNEGIWKAIRNRAGKNGCPITSTIGNEEFVFQYSDGGTDLLPRIQFQGLLGMVWVNLHDSQMARARNG